jgi:GT2 family glycosyltransferase
VHWRDVDGLRRLLAAWPRDPRFELIVVDNGGGLAEALGADAEPARIVPAGGNRGFGGGCNLGAAAARAPWLLFLNPDAAPLPGALEALAAATLTAPPEVAGWVPALEYADGGSQASWQLQPLPSIFTLYAQIFFLGGTRGPASPPAAGTAIEQPAAAALALRRSVFEALGGFDEHFHPAWFEDVDLARRLRAGGHELRYLPSSRFVHDQGSSVPSLGYGVFLWLYDRNLCRYLRKHHGALAVFGARLLLPIAALLRCLALPLRRPRRAASRRAAAAGLLAVVWGALTGFRGPRSYVRRFPEAL